MADYTAPEETATPEPVQDPTPPGDDKPKKPRSAKDWLADIAQAEKDMDPYNKRAKKLQEIYTKGKSETTVVDRKFAILWSNIETLKPAVYAKQPQPAVNRRYADRDIVARTVADVLQRSLGTTFDLADIDLCIRHARDDFLLVGRGTAWVRYVPSFEPKMMGEEQVNALCDETLAFDFVHWSDFIHPKCRSWNDLPWIGRRVYLDQDRFTQRFGQEAYDELKQKPNQKPDNKSDKNTICTYEIWSKRDNEVIWVAKNGENLLDAQPPLYSLHTFWPCPKPAYGTLATDSLVPVPDYVFYQDQAEEIDELTKRIGGLTDALKLTGFYPAGAEGEISSAIEKVFNPSTSNTMIPVPGWAAFVQGGASKQMIEWMPVDMVEQVLKGCIELRKQLIEDVYQITGISDILRGQSEASETATAQNIKAQWGSIRIRDRQAEMARFARDLTQIAAEIIAEKFQPETLWKITGFQFPTQADKQQIQAAMQAQQAQAAAQQPAPEPDGGAVPLPSPQAAPPPMPAPQVPPDAEQIMQKPTQEEVIALLRNDCLRNYRVDIETDSTIEADEQAEKASRNEFLQVVAAFMEQALPIAQQIPALVPMFGEMLTFTVRGYRAGHQLEDVITQAVDEMSEKAKQAENAPPPVDPAIELEKQKFAADQQDKQARLQLDTQDKQTRLQMDQQASQAKVATDQQEAQTKIATMQSKGQLDALNAARQHSLAVAAHNKQMLQEAQDSEQDNTEAGAEGKPQAPSLLDPLGNILKGQSALQEAINKSTVATLENQKTLADGQAALIQALTQLTLAMSKPKTVQVIRGADNKMVGGIVSPAQGSASIN